VTNSLPKAPPASGRLSLRFRNINIVLFGLAFCVMTLVMAAAFNRVIKKISSGYAGSYALSTANALSAHITKELGLMAKAARSDAVRQWLADEDNQAKKARAYEEMSGIVGELYSYNLYVGVGKSRHEYKVEERNEAGAIRPVLVLDENNPDDAWFFECLASDSEYLLNIGLDHILQKKRVWLNYKVVQNGVALGVICTGLEFSHVAGELFSQYGNHDLRGLIVDENGLIHIDSALMDNQEFLHDDFEAENFSGFPAALKSHLKNGHFQGTGEPTVVELPTGPYRYLTLAPIRLTNWSAVILSGSSSLLNMSLFLPVSLTLLVLLIAFALAVNAVSYRLIFLPLGKLERSLARLKGHDEERIYGLARRDELGNLANTIQDLFTQANYDALTGLHNRRFMEDNFKRIMEFLSRSNGLLSVFMLDVDFFKKYNDAYGHEQGDVCLRAVARALAGGITRASDFVARYGGEEFVAVLPNTDEAGARLVAETLLERVRELNLPHAGSQAAPFVTVSIGGATGRVSHKQSWDDYVKRADEALYKSKQNGRNRYTHLDFTKKSE
jgi:diguanylate cyclase (GGDEF)-like protein